MTIKKIKIENPEAEYTEAELKQIIDEDFIEQVFEIAFGNNAINRDFTYDDVIKRLEQFSYNQMNSRLSGCYTVTTHDGSWAIKKY